MKVAFQPATPQDLERLTALKLLVMNDQLARFEREFRPDETRLIACGGAFAGCVTVRPDGDDWTIEHFYLRPEHQGRGLGEAVLRLILAEADAAGVGVRLSVLVESPANRFYPRHGFVETHREAFDIYYRRPSGAVSPRPS